MDSAPGTDDATPADRRCVDGDERGIDEQPVNTPSLTGEQQAAVNGVLCAVREWVPQVCITGPAGTGKTFTTRTLIAALREMGHTVVLAAPTHKACQVLANACGVPKSSVLTVAAALRLRERREGKEIFFEPNLSAPDPIEHADVLVFDEASMIEPRVLSLIRAAAYGRPCIFIGDHAQLPPVDHNHSPALEVEPRYTLTRVMRHDGAILDSATAIRQTTDLRWRPTFTTSSIGDGSAVHTYASLIDWQQAVLNHAEQHPDDSDDFRVLCYRRAEVAAANTAIRNRIYGEGVPTFIPSERVVTVEAVKSRDDIDGPPIYNSTRELRILSAECEVDRPINGRQYRYLAWRLRVQAESADAEVKTLFVVDPTRRADYDRDLEAAAARAKKEKSEWWVYWMLKDSYAELQPPWALTVHKSQGSQFRHVFISPDLDSTPDGVPLQRRLWYTAFTRAQQSVHLVADTREPVAVLHPLLAALANMPAPARSRRR